MFTIFPRKNDTPHRRHATVIDRMITSTVSMTVQGVFLPLKYFQILKPRFPKDSFRLLSTQRRSQVQKANADRKYRSEFRNGIWKHYMTGHLQGGNVSCTLLKWFLAFQRFAPPSLIYFCRVIHNFLVVCLYHAVFAARHISKMHMD